jgi:hypothetical protein
MNTKLFLAAAAAVLSLGAGAAQADTKADSAITEAKVSFHFGFYGNPYYRPYYYQPYYYGPKCFYNYYGQYVCKYY